MTIAENFGAWQGLQEKSHLILVDHPPGIQRLIEPRYQSKLKTKNPRPCWHNTKLAEPQVIFCHICRICLRRAVASARDRMATHTGGGGAAAPYLPPSPSKVQRSHQAANGKRAPQSAQSQRMALACCEWCELWWIADCWIVDCWCESCENCWWPDHCNCVWIWLYNLSVVFCSYLCHQQFTPRTVRIWQSCCVQRSTWQPEYPWESRACCDANKPR